MQAFKHGTTCVRKVAGFTFSSWTRAVLMCGYTSTLRESSDNGLYRELQVYRKSKEKKKVQNVLSWNVKEANLELHANS